MRIFADGFVIDGIVVTPRRLARAKSILQQIAIFARLTGNSAANDQADGRRHRRRHPGGRQLEEQMIKASIVAASASFALAVTAANPAQAGNWTTRWTGPHGGVYEGGGSCANGACQGSGTFTGPNGGVWHQTGNLHQVAPGQWAGERTIVGPNGGTWQNSWTWRSQ